ncbi:elongator complex protein 4 [Acrasis kona]|uniref:Elongator complex protein 4 n=1 Tax=Acrasis kona TaxID=1008807 RepID=A0AAW2ZNE2_9EUKA
MKTSTFIRKGARQQTVPPGAKPSVHNGQLLISSGLRDFDSIVGGGLPVGSLICIQEDRHSQYAQNFIKYFLSEGLSCGHSLAYSLSPLNSINSFLPLNHTERLKAGQASVEDEEDDAESQQNELKIAWRYKEFVDQQVAAKKLRKTTTPITHQQKGTVSCHEYDLSREIQPEIFEKHKSNMTKLQPSNYKALLKDIYDRVKSLRSDASNRTATSILRVGLQSIGSILFNDNSQLIPFLYALRGLMRSSMSTCVFTLSKECISIDKLESLRHACDIVVDMNSFVGADIDVSDWEFKEYSGLLDMVKLPRINSLTTNFTPDSLNYAFKLKRRKMYIERLNLPPEETREASNPDRPKYQESQAAKAEESERIMRDLYGASEDQVMSCSGGVGMVHHHSKTSKIQDTLDF